LTNETPQRLLDALVSCHAIDQYTADLDFAAYESDRRVRDAVERRLGIIGEALSRAEVLEPALVDQIPELRQVVGLRNRVIRGYDAVDDEIVWDIVQNKLPGLRSAWRSCLGRTLPNKAEPPLSRR
jgi:uncharacterized protein with HEPN domain